MSNLNSAVKNTVAGTVQVTVVKSIKTTFPQIQEVVKYR